MSWVNTAPGYFEKEKQLLRIFIALSAEFHDCDMVYSVESLKDLFYRAQLEIQKTGHECLDIVPYINSKEEIKHSLEILSKVGSLKKISEDNYQTNYGLDDVIVAGFLPIRDPQLTALENVAEQWYRDTYKKEPIIKNSPEVKNATDGI